EQPSAKPEVRYVAASEARLRELPNATAPVLANLEKGTRLTVLGQENQWLKITEPGGRAGYINAQLTATSPPAASPPSPAPAVHPATVAKPVKSAAPRPAAKPGEAAPSGWRIVK
ncbi:MAG TPA: SH3 domain-containing protein, partial [Solidesulfovibrio sp.]|nr:SH3 domain-containing protein [Solidesulfovibrio sp.]